MPWVRGRYLCFRINGWILKTCYQPPHLYYEPPLPPSTREVWHPLHSWFPLLSFVEGKQCSSIRQVGREMLLIRYLDVLMGHFAIAGMPSQLSVIEDEWRVRLIKSNFCSKYLVFKRPSSYLFCYLPATYLLPQVRTWTRIPHPGTQIDRYLAWLDSYILRYPSLKSGRWIWIWAPPHQTRDVD